MSRTSYFRLLPLLTLALALAACNYRNNADEATDTDTSAVIDEPAGESPDTSDAVADDEAETEAPDEPPASKNITVDDPSPGTRIGGTSFTISGEARTFENALSYRLIDSNGRLLADGHTTAQGEMGSFSPYSTTVTIGSPYRGEATLEVFQYSAKDGRPIDIVRVPLTIAAGTAANAPNRLEIYFTNATMNTSHDCERVYATLRKTDETITVAERAMELLLRGPSAEERRNGYGTEIPAGTKLRSIRIENGTAHADFSSELNRGGGACHVGAIRAQIEQTLKQFPTVSRVEITVEGNSAEALQP